MNPLNTVAFIWLVTVILIAVGWVMNIIALAHASAVTVLVVLRIIGIFVPPLGAILGYFF